MKYFTHPLFVTGANLTFVLTTFNQVVGAFALIVSVAYTFWKWHKDSNEKK